jgi:hypothetical protein
MATSSPSKKKKEMHKRGKEEHKVHTKKGHGRKEHAR